MALAELLAELDELVSSATAAFEASGDAESLEQIRVEFLGAKNGRLKRAQKDSRKPKLRQKPKPHTKQRQNRAAIVCLPFLQEEAGLCRERLRSNRIRPVRECWRPAKPVCPGCH